MLDRVVIAAGVERMLEGERLLAKQAPGLSLDHLGKLIARVEVWLDPDGVEPREDEARSRRSLTISQRNGQIHMNAVFDAVGGAPVKTFIEGYVSARFQARKDDTDLLGADEDRRTVQQIQADALTALADGIDQPISISAARKLAAGGGVIPWVCGGNGEILDWGREKRLFTSVQKLALVERDGGCAMCGLPPGHDQSAPPEVVVPGCRTH